MAYFLKDSDRVDTCYFEFQKGNWRKEKKHWKDDSIVIGDLEFNDFLYDVIVSVIPKFDYYGSTIITKKQWDEILKKADSIGGKVKEAIKEADSWVKETFQEYGYFTILGV